MKYKKGPAGMATKMARWGMKSWKGVKKMKK